MGHSNTTDVISAQASMMKLPDVWVTQVVGTIEAIMAILALVGNVVFFAVILLKKQLRTYGNVYLANLSVTDILAAVFISAISSDSYFRRGWRFSRTFCVLHQKLHPGLLTISLMLSAGIALNRYVYVVHNEKYRRLTNKVSVAISLAICWIYPIILYSTGDINKSKYQPLVFRCRGYDTPLIKIYFIYGTNYIATAVVVVSYFLIFLFIRKSRRRIQAHDTNQQSSSSNNNSNNNNNKKSPNPQEVRMVKVLIAVFCLCLLGYLPFLILLNVYRALGTRPSPDTLLLLYPCMHIGGVINPILYGVSNKNVRKAYKELITGRIIYKPPTTTTHITNT
ncbi:melatonin receptor type 1A-like [Glandiceps talaboti]